MKKFTWVLAIAAIVGLSAPELDARHHSKGHHGKGRHHQMKKSKKAPVHHAQKGGKTHPIAHNAGRGGKKHPIAHNAAKGAKANGAKNVQGKQLGGKSAKPAYQPMNRLAKN